MRARDGVNHTAFQEPVTEWTDVAALADLAQDKPVAAAVAGVPVVLVRRDDQVHALSTTCVHAGGPAATAQPARQVLLEAGRVLVRSAEA
ncbi:MAG TPA: Rieske 2Fe-2S domain-containing protein [Streptosporangiaceae bacterium]|nr:Rieske 2Fe-2S domain-containing protein [Streptosporangiaceae bacterium]